MNRRFGNLPGWQWSAVTAGVTLLGLMMLLIDSRVGSALGMLALTTPFMDWVAILAAGDAHRAAADVYATPNPFDPLGRPHSYGPWWLWVGHLGLTVADRWWSGALISGAFAIVAAIFLAPSSWKRAVFSVALLISPPVLLGMERANNDLVVFLVLVLVAWLLARWSERGLAGAVACIVVAAVLKFYPIAALAGLPAVRIRMRVIIGAVLVAFLACGVIVWWYQDDFVRAVAVVPKKITVFTYGLRVFAASAKYVLDQPWLILPGIIVGVGIGGWLFIPRVRQLYHFIPLYGGTAFACASGAACWVFCYFVNTNLPYRAVLLLLPARLWLRLWDDEASGPLARRLCVFAVITLWVSCATGSVHAWMVRNQGGLASLLLRIVSLEQTLVLVLTLVLLWSLIGWTVRHWQGRAKRG